MLAPVLAGAADAAWASHGTGAAAGAAYTMPAGTAPTATRSASTAAVTWSAATFQGGPAVAGYVVHRYDSASGAPSTVGGTCAGVVTAASCRESVPPGSWYYTDTPVQLGWTGGESPPGNTVTVPPT